METANKLIYKQTNYFKEDGEEYRIIVTISLDDDWLNAVSNLFDSYTYDVENTDVDKFKMSDVMNVYRIINL